MIPAVYFSLVITWQFYSRQSQKSCTSIVLVPFPWRSHHRNIGCDTLEYSPSSFWEKRSVRLGIKGICLNYCIQFELESGSQSGPGWQMKYFLAIPELFWPAAKDLLKIIDWSVNQYNTDNIRIILIWWLPKVLHDYLLRP